MCKSMLALVMSFVVAPCVVAQAPAPAAPLVPAGATRQIAPHVHLIPDGNLPIVPNVGIVVGTRAVLVVDTGLGDRNGRTVLAEAQKLAGGKPLYLVATHAHPEHDLGASALPAAQLIRSADQSRDESSDLNLAKIFASRSPAAAELLAGATFRKADIDFDKEYLLDLGGVKARLVAMGPNHTPGDTAILIVEDGVLFGGDIAMMRLPNFTSPQSSLRSWIAALDQFTAMKPRILVPSHGPVGDLAFVTRSRAYLALVRDETVKAKQQGQNLDAAITSVPALVQAKFPDATPMQMTAAIRSAYSEGVQP